MRSKTLPLDSKKPAAPSAALPARLDRLVRVERIGRAGSLELLDVRRNVLLQLSRAVDDRRDDREREDEDAGRDEKERERRRQATPHPATNEDANQRLDREGEEACRDKPHDRLANEPEPDEQSADGENDRDDDERRHDEVPAVRPASGDGQSWTERGHRALEFPGGSRAPADGR